MKARKFLAGLLAAILSTAAGNYCLSANVPANALNLMDSTAAPVQQPDDVTPDEEWLYTTVMETTTAAVTTSTALSSSEEQSETTAADIDWIKRVSGTYWRTSTGRFFNDTDEQAYAKFEINRIPVSDIEQITGRITIDGGNLEKLYRGYEVFTTVGYTMEYEFDDEDDLTLYIYLPSTETCTLRLTDSKCCGTGGQMRSMNDAEDTIRIRTSDSTEIYTTTTSEPHAYTTTIAETTSSEALTTPAADVHSTDTQFETTTTEASAASEETTEETTTAATTSTEETTTAATTSAEETTTATTASAEETTTATTASAEDTATTETTIPPTGNAPDESLPQTGFPQWFNILIAGAAAMTAAGGLAVKKSGVWKKEKEE